jgi:GNAT superfamily N-acetyltransferase
VVTITRAALDHLDILTPLFDGYRQFYQQPSDLAGARQFLSERLSKNESVIFLALDGDTGLGFTQLYPSFSSVSMKRLWILNDLFVAPEARKRGVGEALMERARQFAIETGAKGLMLETAIDNYTAQRLYERMGWQRENDSYVYNLRV